MSPTRFCDWCEIKPARVRLARCSAFGVERVCRECERQLKKDGIAR